MIKKCKRREIQVPDEVILYEILPKLPVKSLCRFKCLSKLWNSTICTDPLFLKAQLAHSSSSNNTRGERLLVTFTPLQGDLNTSYLLSINNNDEEKEKEEDHWPLHIITQQRLRSFSQSVQGLNLIKLKPTSPGPDSVFIINTATRKQIHLPSPPFLFEKNQHDGDRYEFAFGFDPVHLQHKVLCTRICSTDGGHTETAEHKILTLTRPVLHWRPLRDVPTHAPVDSYKSICINGFVYYVATVLQKQKQKHMIVEFDVTTETFDFIKFPPGMHEYYFRTRLINCSNESLGFVLHSVDEDGRIYYWSSDEVYYWTLLSSSSSSSSKKRSWVKKIIKLPINSIYHINMVSLGCLYRIVGTVDSTGEFIIDTERVVIPYYVNLFNPKTRCLRVIKISQVPKHLESNHHMEDVCHLVETML